MKKLRSAALAAVLALASAAPASAVITTPNYTSITVFGDSLVDAGNLNSTSGGTIAPASRGYFMGRFTNGYDYTDLLSLDLFGVPTVRSTVNASGTGGNNYAYGLAQAQATSAVPDFPEQLASFAADRAAGKQRIDRNGLYAVNFGGNDIFTAPDDPTLASAYLRLSARSYADGIQSLADLGVRNFLVTGYPVLTDPRSEEAEGYLTAELARLTLAPDVTLFRFSYLDFFRRVGSDPASLGLPVQDTTRVCNESQADLDNGCVGVFFFDRVLGNPVHPSAPIQAAAYRSMRAQFGLVAAAADVPEPSAWAALLSGFAMVGALLRRRGGRVAPRRAAC